MFTFNTCLRFSLTYKFVNVQKKTFNFKRTLPVYGKYEKELKVNTIFG